MKKFIFPLIVLLASCSKEEIIIDEVEEIVEIIPHELETLSERFSPINETSGFFKAQEKFTEYLSKDYLWNTLSVPFDGHTHWHTANKNVAILDINGSGQQDILAFATSFCNDHDAGYHKGKVLLILDYKNNSIPQVFDSENRYASGKMEVNDFDNDNISEVLMFSTESKMNMYNEEENVGGNTNLPPLPLVLFDYDNGTLNASTLGIAMDSHTGASGDIDNDGDIDFIQWPVPSIYNDEEVVFEPTLQLNNGGLNFTSQPLILDLNTNDWYASAIDLFDINNDGNLDIIAGWRVGSPLWYEVYPNYFNSLTGPVIMYGDGTGNFYKANSIEVTETFLSSRNMSASILGYGFTDYDKDGDIDIILSTTRDEPGGTLEGGRYYRNFYLIFLENNNGSFLDRTEEKIQNSYNEDGTYTNFYFIRTIDINLDGYTDLIPDGFASWDLEYDTNLKWINNSGTFIRN